MVDPGMSPELERLVAERLQAEVQGLKIKFSLCFAAVLFALAAASLFWGGLKSKRSKTKRRESRRNYEAAEGSGDGMDQRETPSAGNIRAARHLLRNRVSVCCDRTLMECACACLLLVWGFAACCLEH